MSYAKGLLSRGEEIVYESRQHWFAVVAQTWLFLIVAVLTFAIVLWQTTSEDWTLRGILQIASLLALLASLGFLGLKIWSWRNQEYLVTTRRVIKAQGIFNKSMGDSSLEKVNDAHLTQSWIGRIFGYGTLDILTAADEAEQTGINDFVMLAEPVEFKIAMLNAKERLERPELAPPPAQRPAPPPAMQRAEPMPPRAGSDRVQQVYDDAVQAPAQPAAPPPAQPAPAAPGAPPADHVSTLERLADLRDRGLITPEEYDVKKRELLERM